jgi:hypothetical protein
VSRLCVAPIVEGHGEVESIRILLQRIWIELVGGEFVNVLRPIRRPRSKLVQEEELKRAVDLAFLKLTEARTESVPGMALILIDANSDPACVLGPQLLRWARHGHADEDIACVLAVVEFESWFVASASSLQSYLRPGVGENVMKPETSHQGKGWVKKYFKGASYSETLDQPSMTSKMDLALCRKNSLSFDKLCRELELRRNEMTAGTTS